MIIENINQLSELLRKLGHKSSYTDNRGDFLPKLDDQLYRAIRPFLINFIEHGTQISIEVVDAYKKIFDFFPLSQSLLGEIMRSLSDISCNHLKAKSNRIRAEVSPVAYFMVKAMDLNGFPLLALPGRDLIIKEGAAAIPPLLVACSAMPEGLKHFSLSPSDILSSPERYFKHNGQKLAEATKDGYGRFLKKLLLLTGEIFSIFEYGSGNLFLEGEHTELLNEEQQRKKLYFKAREIPFFSSPQVLKPHILKHVLISDKGDANDLSF